MVYGLDERYHEMNAAKRVKREKYFLWRSISLSLSHSRSLTLSISLHLPPLFSSLFFPSLLIRSILLLFYTNSVLYYMQVKV